MGGRTERKKVEDRALAGQRVSSFPLKNAMISIQWGEVILDGSRSAGALGDRRRKRGRRESRKDVADWVSLRL